MEFVAKWIWHKQKSYKDYNSTIIANKSFECDQFDHAVIKITADSFYRLYINSKWVNDGPCRSWPEHYKYDEIDVTAYLKSGNNEIKVIARYYGVGDFHCVPQQAGLLVQLDVKLCSGKVRTIISDESWDVAPANAWLSNTPKISIQMEPAEYYDARREGLEFTKAQVLFNAYEGPWKELNCRDVALLARRAVSFESFVNAKVVRCDGLSYTFSPMRFFYPELVEANSNTKVGCGLATVLKVDQACCVNIVHEGLKISVDGKFNPDGKYQLAAGSYLVAVFVDSALGHTKDYSITFLTDVLLKLENPIDAESESPWRLIAFDDSLFLEDDMEFWWFVGENKEYSLKSKKYIEQVEQFLSSNKDINSFRKNANEIVKSPRVADIFVEDGFWKFRHRREISNGYRYIINPEAILGKKNEMLVVNPCADGDIELAFDLGQQCCGYYDFELVADEGVTIDIYGVEYISPTGEIQHTDGNRNGMRYITRKGVNQFTSLKRRSGRYIFITLRNQKMPVQFRRVQLIESTYPADSIGSFSCSDENMNEIWKISERTLKLCMEDVFTDCPLYEQTLWVGDARNESLFGYYLYDSRDIAQRCIKIAAQSLERFPIVGCQVPSSWKCLLPAWSSLWGISVWEYYFYTGDINFLRKMWVHIISNLKGAQEFLGKDGLFTAPFWNMFDWAHIDQEHRTVLHNSMFLVGALDAALKCATVLDDTAHYVWLKQFRDNLCRSINKFWNCSKKAYPDSIHGDGIVSDSVSQHTNFLSVLYDIVEEKNRSHVVSNVLHPSDQVIKVGSPFASFYLYEALEKIEQSDAIIDLIYKSYMPMLEVGATTVWESFAHGTTGNGTFPTRSHCHGWSASPVYFLNRIILGIRQIEAGCKAFQISPRPNGLSWAKGSVASIYGPISVEWSIDGNRMDIVVRKPACIRVEYCKNSSLDGLEVTLNMDGLEKRKIRQPESQHV